MTTEKEPQAAKVPVGQQPVATQATTGQPAATKATGQPAATKATGQPVATQATSGQPATTTQATTGQQPAATKNTKTKPHKSGANKILNTIGTIGVIIIVVITILLVGTRLVNIYPYTVLSGSMEPTYHTGSLIYVKQVDPFQLQSGDVITFMLDEDTLATHRIVEVVPDDEDPSTIRFRTKGDANEFIDGSLVHYKNVVGTPIFTIPYLGYLANFVQNPPGIYVAIAFCAFLVLLAFLPDLFDEEKPKKQDKKRKREEADEGTDSI